MSKTPLYNDKHMQIFEDKIRFKSWILPWGKKDVMLSNIRKVSEKNIGLSSGQLRISGSSNFRDWFHFDATRPTKKKAIVLETDFKVYKRLWITPEKHASVFNILKKLV
ncbi:MAG: hypothetical protein OES15_01670 [Nitrosopumilus sp.]|jgi:hypothetical protein|nr:hypothetical protein [Nitrosopumilus sp.]